MTVAAAISQFFVSDEASWDYTMAVALVYSLPPIAIYFALRRFMSFDRVRQPARMRCDVSPPAITAGAAYRLITSTPRRWT